MTITITFLFLLLGLHGSHNFLFSRSRNPNEFIAPQDNLALDELDPKTYADLLEEIPELRSHIRRPRPESREPLGMPYRQYKDEQSEEYDYMINGLEADVRLTTTTKRALQNTTINTSRENPQSMAAAPAGAHDKRTAAAAAAGNGSDPRRWGWGWDWDWEWKHYWKGPLKATCYYCNMRNSHRSIPIGSLCHDAWESPDWQAKTMARYFRAHCYRNLYHWDWKIETKKDPYGRLHETDRGLIRGYYGAYIGGCFKRFLDVGKVYTARGCRSNEMKQGGGFANHRFRKLEGMLLGQKDACIMSPHASLTPFSRAISLYVRYHVCVCEGKYCNKARPRTIALLVPLLLVLHVLL